MEYFINILSLISVLSFIFFIYYFFSIVNNSGEDFSLAGGDYRDIAQKGRPISNKVFEVLMDFGIISFLLTSSRQNTIKRQYTKLLAMITFFLPAIAMLILGARGKFVVTIVLFFFILLIHGKTAIPVIRCFKIDLIKLTLFSLFLILVSIVMVLFKTRGVRASDPNIFLLYSGDIELRTIYEDLNTVFDGALTPFYKASHYITHSLSFFSWLFQESDYSSLYFGLFSFRIIGLLLAIFGIEHSSYLDIVYSQPFWGYYPTFVQGYLLDFGPYFSPFFIFITGMAFGLIYNMSHYNKDWKCFLPVVLSMCLFSPVYFFWHIGSLDFIALFFGFIIAVKKIGGIVFREGLYKIRYL